MDTPDGARTTTIKISMALRTRLKSHGKMDDTYETLISRLLDFYESNKQVIKEV